MQVNNEQTNTQKMLEHNQARQKAKSGGSLQRSLVDVCENNIDMKESIILNCRNYSNDLLKTFCVTSDADPQLIVKIKFIEKCDISNISFSPSDQPNSDDVSPPRMVKIFTNQPDMDFNDIESMSASLSVELPLDNENDKPFSVSLQGSKFTRLSSIQIFIEDNFGTDFTTLGKIKINGFLAPSYH